MIVSGAGNDRQMYPVNPEFILIAPAGISPRGEIQRRHPEEERIVSHDAFFQMHYAISQSWQISS